MTTPFDAPAQIRFQLDCNRHMDYFHFNPVKHGLVETVKSGHTLHFNVVLNATYILWIGVRIFVKMQENDHKGIE